MIKKKLLSAAFTLIELLVVITIIGILAGIALPVFNSVQIKGAQTKVLAQAKQVGLALKLYAGDNSGTYPIYVAGGGTPPANTTNGSANKSTANYDYSLLFPTYTQSEAIFANKYSYYNKVVPDNVIDQTPQSPPSQTLKSGENSFAYMEGLSDTNNPASPLVLDAPSAASIYVNTPNTAGYVWGQNKAVVIHLDNSASLDTLTQAGTGAGATFTDSGYDPLGAGAAKINILDVTKNTSLTGCTLCLPN